MYDFERDRIRRPFAPLARAAWLLCLIAATLHSADARAAAPNFEVQEIATDLTVGYAVSLVDMNADGRLDIAVVDSKRVVWYENPSWTMRTLIEGVTKPDNVCFAPYDIDGDGRLDFALGADWRPMDTVTGGTMQWISRSASEPANGAWAVRMIGEEPTVHRMRWIDTDGEGAPELVVVPLMGRNSTKPHYSETPVRILAFPIPADPSRDRWTPRVLNEEMHVAHNFVPTDLNRDGRTDILVTSFEGVNLLERGDDRVWRRTLIGTGNQETSPERGASEIKHGLLAGGKDYIATIEPWHGFQVVVYLRPTSAGETLWRRTVIDDELKWGHAVWCANLDGDEDQELIIGVRDNKDETHLSGLRVYDPSAGGAEWGRTLVDAGGVAIEDLAADDLDGDGLTDIVAVGRATHNARIYWNRGEASR